ncbi:hypothetical protein RBB50_006374 [Rhinocladiella similis]
MAIETEALVSYGADNNFKADWRFERVKLLRSPGQHELKVRMVASGICHSDIVAASLPPRPEWGLTFPRIFGHEGAGIVEEVGPEVTVAKVGDPVLLSYSYCGKCDLCKINQQGYCLDFTLVNVSGEKGLFEAPGGQDAPGKFLGQSSFAGISIVNEASVVNVNGLVNNNEELKLLAPLGCGLMTGSGAVINGAGSKPHDIVLVTGLGAVGLGAIMAAKIAGCAEIIAIDRVGHRLETAKELGATKVLDTTKVGADFAEDIRDLVQGRRISIIIETTGAMPVIEAGVKVLGQHGRFIQLGAPSLLSEVKIPLHLFFTENKSFECHFLGNTTGQEWVPVMIKWWREGRFPLEKLVKHFPAMNSAQALHEMENGTAIKPVLVW